MQVSTQWGERQKYRDETGGGTPQSKAETLPGSLVDAADDATQDQISDQAAADAAQTETEAPESQPRPPDGRGDGDAQRAGGYAPTESGVTDGNRDARLVRAVEAEIVPRLLMAHRQADMATPEPPAQTPGVMRADLVNRMSDLVRFGREGQASQLASDLRRDGVTVESLFLDLLAPTARRLGNMWEQDEASFADVTMGLWRLQQLMRELSPVFQTEATRHVMDRKALLAPVPGEQHVFGVSMVAEFFHRAGWETFCAPLHSTDQLVEMVGGEWFNVAGLSVSGESQLDAATKAIREVRKRSANPRIGVMVGGHIFHEYPGLVQKLGADLSAPGGPDAPMRAAELVDGSSS
jgi:methanogenic corrinoid protein MtbC1